mmetsp:Transcript_75683/g.239292  ORF Transcript_75683/g.239292 Transcript_75683/m.239292 type:complete len:311 (+) Transcript_75683:415-1347(+)
MFEFPTCNLQCWKMFAEGTPGIRGHPLHRPMASYRRVQDHRVNLVRVHRRDVERAQAAERAAHDDDGARGRPADSEPGQQLRQRQEEGVGVPAQRDQGGRAAGPAEAAVVGEEGADEARPDEVVEGRARRPRRELRVPAPVQQQGRLSAGAGRARRQEQDVADAGAVARGVHAAGRLDLASFHHVQLALRLLPVCGQGAEGLRLRCGPRQACVELRKGLPQAREVQGRSVASAKVQGTGVVAQPEEQRGVRQRRAGRQPAAAAQAPPECSWQRVPLATLLQVHFQHVHDGVWAADLHTPGCQGQLAGVLQ